MKRIIQSFRSIGPAILVILALSFAGNQPALAQTAPTEATVKALQEALNKQGITVAVDGKLNDATRDAIKKYQSQHHLPVTGEPDKATLDKLGVKDQKADSSTPSQDPKTNTQAQAPTQMMQGNMMNCQMMQSQMDMMQGRMQQMMGMMENMMTMMRGMKEKPM